MMSMLENMFKPKVEIEDVLAEEVISESNIDDSYEYASSEESSNETQTYDEDLTNQNDSGETEEDADEV